MNRDLSELLQEWPHEPGRINVRLIEGGDERPKIQVRLDLGLIQMELDGRPDGLAPDGYESLLEAFEARIDEALALRDPTDRFAEEEAEPAFPGSLSDDGDEGQPESSEPRVSDPSRLSPDDCRRLRDEAAQYYHRYVALLVLEDYDRVVRDTTRNLRVIELCSSRASTDEDRTALEAVRPYVTMMRSRALASQALKDKEPKAAIHAIDLGLSDLRRHFDDMGLPDQYETSGEAQMLRSMREALVPKLPVSQKTELRHRLREALERENYELAAILRDELRMMGG